jgi:cell division protein FtsB
VGWATSFSASKASVSNAQQQWQDDKQASRINPIALTTVLISIISILVGGAWLVSGSLARSDERSVHQQRKVIDRMELRQWLLQGMGGPNVSAPEASTQ